MRKFRKTKPSPHKGLIGVSSSDFEADVEALAGSLKRTNDFLDSVIENIPHMIFVKDADELRFVRFNKAGEDLIGYSKAQMIGKNDYDFFPPQEADFFTMKDREVLAKGQLFDIPEEPIHTKHNGIRILHTKKIPILDKDGKALYLLGISEDITERKRLEKEILEISDREQRRIGQDLHDGLGQVLTGVAFMSMGLAKRLATTAPTEASEAVQIAELVNQAITKTRDLALVLNPVELESHGLASALEVLAANTQKLFDVRCRFETNAPFYLNDHFVSLHLYRIAQEAVDNAIRHGRPTEISIFVSSTQDKLQLEIVDNGIGIVKTSGKSKGMGLHNMRNRAKMIAASIAIGPGEKGGTMVCCSLRRSFEGKK